MVNASVILFSGIQFAPGIEPELILRYKEWADESYTPLRTSLPGSLGADRYEIITARPEYPFSLLTYHLENTELAEKSTGHPDRIALLKDINTWIDRRVLQFVWGYYYELITGFSNENGRVVPVPGTLIDGAPFMHIEGYRMPLDDQGKYVKWLHEWGFNVLIPLITKLPGLKGYYCYRDPHLNMVPVLTLREQEYPQFITIIYFESQEAFTNYTKSSELLAFQKAISNTFPSGLNYKWYVQYQLVKSFRK